MLDESEDNRLDQSLRDVFGDYELPPTAPVWAGIEERLAQLPPPVLPVRKRRRPVPLPFWLGLVALLAGLGGWLLPHSSLPAAKARRVTAVAPAAPAITEVGREDTRVPSGPTSVASKRTRVRFMGTAVASEGTQVSSRLAAAPSEGTRVRSTLTAVPSKGTRVRFMGTAVASKGTRVITRYAVVGMGREKSLRSLAGPAGRQIDTPSAPLLLAGNLPASYNSAAAALAAPASLRALISLEATYEDQPKPSLTDPATASRATIVATLRAERTELLRLQRRADSLLLALGEVPLAAPLIAQADTTLAKPEPPKPDARPLRRWSLLLAAAPEQNALGLQGRETDKLTALRRNHEIGRAGISASLLAEYRLNQRVSVGAGLGYNTFGTEFRLTNRRTEVDVTYETKLDSTLRVSTTHYDTYSIRIRQVPVLTPHFNGNGQVVGYDTVYTSRNDTLRTTTVLHDTLRTTTKTTTPVLNKREVVTSKTFRPQYRFLTLPVQLRYRITPPGTSRWWTDVAVGAQLQFFLGGTQAVTDDGENYRTEKITVGNGPFRPFNLALSGSLALNYGLTKRLSLSVAPSLRWQALSIYKAETGLRQQATATGLLFGMRWAL